MQLHKVALASALAIALTASAATAAHAANSLDVADGAATFGAAYAPSADAVDFKVLASTPRSITVSWNASAFAPERQLPQFEGEVSTLTSLGYPGSCTFGIGGVRVIKVAQPDAKLEDGAYSRTVQPHQGGTQVTVLDAYPGMHAPISLDCSTSYDSKVVDGDGAVEQRSAAYALSSSYESEGVEVAAVAPLAPTLGDRGGFLTSDGGNLYFSAAVALDGDGAITQAQYTIYRNGAEFKTRTVSASEEAGEDWYHSENFPPTMGPGSYGAKVRFANAAGWGPWSAVAKIVEIEKPVANPLDADDSGSSEATAEKVEFKRFSIANGRMSLAWSTSASIKRTVVTYAKAGRSKPLHVQKFGPKVRHAAWKSKLYRGKGSFGVTIVAYTTSGKKLVAKSGNFKLR